MTTGLLASDFIPFFCQRGIGSPRGFGAVMLAATAIDFAILAAILRIPMSQRLTAGAIVRAGLFTLAAFIVKLVLVQRVAALSGFGVIFAAWCNLNFAVAPVAWLALLQWKRGRSISAAAWPLIAIGLAIWPAAAYAHFVEPFRLKVERVDVPIATPRGGAEPIRIAVLADLQTDRVTDYERHVIDGLLALQPDVILLPGDLFQGSAALFESVVPEYRGLLARLDAPGGVYFVTGDVDPPIYVSGLLAGTKIRQVDNEIVHVEVKGARLAICGLCPQCSTFGARAALQSLGELDSGDDELRIVFAHHPDDIMLIDRSIRVDLFVAGHTHGGQIALPFVGPLLTLSAMPRTIGAGGLHEFEGRRIYVSRGVGHERSQSPRIRFLCPPEISLLTITREDP